jgi:oligopeptidase B
MDLLAPRTLRLVALSLLLGSALADTAAPPAPPAGPSPAPAAAPPASASPVPASLVAVPQPPVAARRDHLQSWHGEKVNDPWFWLREKESPQVRAYLEAENAYTEAMTRGIAPFADALYAEMLGRIQQTDLSVPVRRGAWLYYARTVEGLQYPIHCRKAAAADGSLDEGAPEQVLLDQNELAKGKPFLGLGDLAVSDDGRRLLFSTDESGFRQYRLFVKELETGEVKGPLAERVTSYEWAADGRTIFYSTEDAVTKRSDTVWRLAPGAAAEKVFEEKDELFTTQVARTRDRKYLVVASEATDTWESRILAADRPGGEFRVVLSRRKGHKYDVDHRDGLLYIRTNRGAKDFRIVTAPVSDPSPRRWRTFLAHRPGVLVEELHLFAGYAVVSELREGLTRFRVRDFAKGTWHEVSFPEPVYAAGAGENPEFDSRLFRFAYHSPVTPPAVFDYDLGSRARTLRKQQEVLGGYDPARYATERLWATARDGTRVPISVVYRKGTPRDGSAPLWLYGYGSYGIAMTPRFDSNRVSLLDRGVVWAIAHVRGGNELGERWHDDGMLMHKKNTFTDFVDCAEHLVRERWTSKDRLLAEGGSAGGLLMGAAVNLRPDLFRAVHTAVPFVDVMNTMMDATLPLTVGEYLEWGNPNERKAFDYMRSYSPYDNLARAAYPAILVTTSFNDSQVMYWEPAKYVAKLRTLKTDDRPLLLKTKLDPAGHGGASGRYDRLHDRAFEAAWMLSQVGIER